MPEQSSSGSERAHLSVPRVRLRDFLHEAGCHLFPAQWPDSFQSDPHGSGEVGMSIVGRVECELNYALRAGLIPIEVDLQRLPEDDRVWAAEDEKGILRYFKLLNSSFESFSEVDGERAQSGRILTSSLQWTAPFRACSKRIYTNLMGMSVTPWAP